MQQILLIPSTTGYQFMIRTVLTLLSDFGLWTQVTKDVWEHMDMIV